MKKKSNPSKFLLVGLIVVFFFVGCVVGYLFSSQLNGSPATGSAYGLGKTEILSSGDYFNVVSYEKGTTIVAKKGAYVFPLGTDQFELVYPDADDPSYFEHEFYSCMCTMGCPIGTCARHYDTEAERYYCSGTCYGCSGPGVSCVPAPPGSPLPTPIHGQGNEQQ